LLLVDLAARARDLRAHYTDFGILPRAELGLYTWRTVWTLHGVASPHPALVAALFALAAAFAVLLALGWRTRLATFVSWLLLTSLQYRNPALVFGGDVMLRMLLFWGLFLPLGARWSVDANRRPPSDSYASVASFALIVQVGLVYVFSALNRTGPTWWDGRALHDALHFDQFASGVGIWLRGHEAWLPPMTYAAIWFEALGALLAVAPIATGPLRTLAVALFLGFHATLGALFQIGLFPAVFAVAWIGLLPTWFWDRVAPRTRRARPPLRASALAQALAAAALALVLLANFASLRVDPLTPRASRWYERPAEWLYVDQLWGLFSPDPPLYDGWYVFLGVQADGAEVDPFWHGPVSFVKPAVVSDTMNIRWREFFFRLQRDKNDPHWSLFGDWLCRAWNETHAGPERLDRAYVYYVEETTNRPANVADRTLTTMVHGCQAE
jgi:Vitamin K-dependent gamma-carboxylase